MFQIETKPTSSIIISNRARKDLGDLTSLKESITKSGQLNPILITSDNHLIAGERRLKALTELNQPEVLVRIMPNLSPDDLLIIELMENVARKDFTWHEELELKQKLHHHWKEKASDDPEISNWGFRETAKELNCSLGGLSTDLTLAEAIDSFPELKECDNKTQAKNLYKKIGDQAKALQAMDNISDEEKARMNNLMSGNIPKEIPQAKHTDEDITPPSCSPNEQTVPTEQKVTIPDAVYAVKPLEKFIPDIPNESVGFIELDPPYAIDFDNTYGNALGKKQTSEDDWDEAILRNFYANTLPLLYNKLLDSSWILCWTGVEHWQWTNEMAKAAGFKVQSKPGIWVKPGGSCNTPKTTMISNYEMFLLFRKGKASFNTNSFLSTVQCATTPGAKKIHQWEKPLDLYEHFFQAMRRPGSIFLSPFAGSGNSMIVAAKNGMLPMGCDLRQKYALSFYERYKNFFMETN